MRITLGQARWRPPGRERWIYLAELAPRHSYFHAPPEVFDAAYLDQLAHHAAAIEDKLGWLTQDGPVCLLCFERYVRGPADCHRRLFAAWWTQRTGEEVPELDGSNRRARRAGRDPGAGP